MKIDRSPQRYSPRRAVFFVSAENCITSFFITIYTNS